MQHQCEEYNARVRLYTARHSILEYLERPPLGKLQKYWYPVWDLDFRLLANTRNMSWLKTWFIKLKFQPFFRIHYFYFHIYMATHCWIIIVRNIIIIMDNCDVIYLLFTPVAHIRFCISTNFKFNIVLAMYNSKFTDWCDFL